MSLARALARWALEEVPPAEALRAARVSLADAIAVMAAAVRLEPAAAPYRAYALTAGGGASSVIGGGSAPPAMAALANGALAHALDFEDTFDAAGLHPNAALVPAVLALAEAEGAADADVLAALAAGADAACRIGLMLAADPAGRGWYHPPMIGCAGAALGAARVLRLDEAQAEAAVSLALCRFVLTDGLKSDPASPLRAVRDGFAAAAAVEGALLARAGARGVAAPLEGAGGLIRLLSGAAPGDLPHGGWLGAGVGVKRWPCCRGTHRFVAAALAMRAQGLAPGDVTDLVADVAPPDGMLLAPLADRQAPRTAIGAKFSIPWTVAWTLLRGAPGLGAFAPDALQDPEVRALAGRVRPGRDGPGVAPGLHVTLTGGARTWVPAQATGEPPAHALPLEILGAKLSDCIGDNLAADLIAAVGLQGPSPRPLARLLRGYAQSLTPG